MKILLINDYSTLTGGAEISIVGLRDELRKQGHDARLFASSAQPLNVPRHADYECFGTVSRFRTLLQTFNPWAYLKLRRILKEFKPDVVHVYIFLTQLSPLILPLLKNHKSVHQVVWQRPICPTGFKLLPDGTGCTTKYGAACLRSRCLSLHNWLLLMAQMKMWERWRSTFDRVVSISQSLSKQLAQDGIISTDIVFLGAKKMPSRSSLSATPIVVYSGRLAREKGLAVLCEAFALVLKEAPTVRLLIAGDGPERRSIESLISSLGIAQHVDLLGHLSHEELSDRFANVWAQVVPSLMHEPFGLAASEALIRGTTVIASNCGGPSEMIVDGENGFLVPPNDSASLCDAILEIVTDREKAERMGAAAKEKAQKVLSEEVCVKKLLDIWSQLAPSTERKRNLA